MKTIKHFNVSSSLSDALTVNYLKYCFMGFLAAFILLRCVEILSYILFNIIISIRIKIIDLTLAFLSHWRKSLKKLMLTSPRTRSSVIFCIDITSGTLLNFIKKQKLSYSGHRKRHQTLKKLVLEWKMEGQTFTDKSKETLGEVCKGYPRWLWHDQGFLIDCKIQSVPVSRIEFAPDLTLHCKYAYTELNLCGRQLQVVSHITLPWQFSALGPILFVLYINDLPSNILLMFICLPMTLRSSQKIIIRSSDVRWSRNSSERECPNVNTFKNRLDGHWGKKTSYTTTKHPYQDTTWLTPELSDLNTLIWPLRPPPAVMKDPN